MGRRKRKNLVYEHLLSSKRKRKIKRRKKPKLTYILTTVHNMRSSLCKHNYSRKEFNRCREFVSEKTTPNVESSFTTIICRFYYNNMVGRSPFVNCLEPSQRFYLEEKM